MILNLKPQTKPNPPLQTGLLQRQCAACGQHTIAGGECSECKKKQSSLNRSTALPQRFAKPFSTHTELSSSNQPLLGRQNFSKIPVHTASKAILLSPALNHLAIADTNLAFRRPLASCISSNHRANHMGAVRCRDGELQRIVYQDHCAGNCVAQHEETHRVDQSNAEVCRDLQQCLLRSDGGVDTNQLAPGAPQEDWFFQGLCQDTYNGWHTQHSDRMECAAYNVEIQCLSQTLYQRCGQQQETATNIGRGVGTALLGAGGGVGGYFAGTELLTSSLGSVGAGVLGAGIGALAGGLLGFFVGGAIGSAAAGSQASSNCCNTLREELNFAREKQREHCPNVGAARGVENPFNPDGSIRDTRWIRGVLRAELLGGEVRATAQTQELQSTDG